MGPVWRPSLVLGNALYDRLDAAAQAAGDLSRLWTAIDEAGAGPRRALADHILYSRRQRDWVRGAAIRRLTRDGLSYSEISAHAPLTVRVVPPPATD